MLDNDYEAAEADTYLAADVLDTRPADISNTTDISDVQPADVSNIHGGERSPLRYLCLHQQLIFIVSAFFGFLAIVIQYSLELEKQRTEPGFVRPGWARHRDNCQRRYL